VGPCAINCINNHEVYSFHPTGANVLLTDGSVRFASQNVSIGVADALVTRAGGEYVSANDF
jgi:prepilin-type processing-associated H-X9-DG protein